MADVTDCAYRQIIAKYGKPDIFFTEFVSADGLCSAGKDKLLIDFIYGESERPIVAQIFGSNINNIRKASALCKALHFDGIDINMGCPDKSVEKQLSGAAMIKNPKLAREVIRAAKEGGGGLPVSVKTRIGYNKNEIETWIPELLKEDLAALTLHLRTRKEMSDVPAHWEVMKRIIEIRDQMKVKTLILGNGDVQNIIEAKQKIKKTGCDGVMLGRAIFGNAWLFEKRSPFSFSAPEGPALSPQRPKKGAGTENEKGQSFAHTNTGSIPVTDKLRVMVEHTKLYEKMLGKHKNFAIMKKHFKAYVNGFEGAKELRVKLMDTDNASQVEKKVNDFLSQI